MGFRFRVRFGVQRLGLKLGCRSLGLYGFKARFRVRGLGQGFRSSGFEGSGVSLIEAPGLDHHRQSPPPDLAYPSPASIESRRNHSKSRGHSNPLKSARVHSNILESQSKAVEWHRKHSNSLSNSPFDFALFDMLNRMSLFDSLALFDTS